MKGRLLKLLAAFRVLSPSTTELALQGSSQAGRIQLNHDFPDPSIIEDGGTWYAFATNTGNIHIQAARALHPLGPWQYLEIDVLPGGAPWTTGKNTWAPDVRRVQDGTFILYFSGELAGGNGKHCVGIATSDKVTGPFRPQEHPWVCHLDQGGAIDASGFQVESTGKRYVVYKIDGNRIGRGGDCNNGVPPETNTPLVLQEVGADGHTKVGREVVLLNKTPADGPLIEAPDLVRLRDGTYILFFSSFCFTSKKYNVSYATSRNVRGPYVRARRPLLRTGDFGLEGPGSATAVVGLGQGREREGLMVFHGNCAQGRCLYATGFSVVE